MDDGAAPGYRTGAVVGPVTLTHVVQIVVSAGTARAVITPQRPIWLSGYAGKRVPDGKLHDLWVKALALEDADGRRAVLLTSDLIGFSRAAYDDLCAELKRRHGLSRDQLLLTFSHTHSGPVLRDSLTDYFPLDDEARRLVEEYSRGLEATVVDVVGRALLICGIAGYRNDSKFSLCRHLRDAYGAALMVNNDRILKLNATMLLA